METAGALAVTIEPDSGELLCHDPQSDELPLWAKVMVSGLFPLEVPRPQVEAALAAGFGAVPGGQWSQVESTDWEAGMRAHCHARFFAPRLWVYPTWEPPVFEEGHVGVSLDPGRAFGTGSHPTTALCLAWLAQDSAHWERGVTVLDYGCGSGILAIAALRLGAHQAFAVDVDREALATTRENATRNGVLDRLETALPTHLGAVRADIVVANILARPLIEHAADLQAALAPGGALLLSGFTTEQAALVEAAYPAIQFVPRICEDWVLLAGTTRRGGVHAMSPL